MSALYLRRLRDADDDDVYFVLFEHANFRKPVLLLNEFEMQALDKQYHALQATEEERKKRGTRKK